MLNHISSTLKSRITIATGMTNVSISSMQGDGAVLANDKLHIFLHGVRENGHLRNRPQQRSTDGLYRPAPMGLTLDYLIIYKPKTDDHEEEQTRLSQILEAFYTHPRLNTEDLVPEIADVVDHLTVRLRSPGAEEMNQIWTALNRAKPLALYYEVNAALIPQAQAIGTTPVTEYEAGYLSP